MLFLSFENEKNWKNDIQVRHGRLALQDRCAGNSHHQIIISEAKRNRRKNKKTAASDLSRMAEGRPPKRRHSFLERRVTRAKTHAVDAQCNTKRLWGNGPVSNHLHRLLLSWIVRLKNGSPVCHSDNGERSTFIQLLIVRQSTEEIVHGSLLVQHFPLFDPFKFLDLMNQLSTAFQVKMKLIKM